MEKFIPRKLVTFLMLRGLPASGKSTFAGELVRHGWKRLNKDMMRDMIDGGEFSPEKEDSLNQLLYDMAFHYLSRGYNVVNDNMNFNIWHFKQARAICDLVNTDHQELKCELIVKDFHTPIDECVKRDAKRPKPVSKRVIRQIYAKWIVDGKFPDVKDLLDD